MSLPSRLIEKAVEAFTTLPGIGRKSALRLVLHLLKQDKQFTEQFAEALLHMRREIMECRICHNLSDNPECLVCSDRRRDRSVICVVENVRDLMAIEDTGQFKGLYHVLGGLISPMEGIGPADLHIDSLIQRLETREVREIIMAVSPTIEGETTIFYLSKRILPLGVVLSTIARGVSFGGELEYADELTLGRSIVARVPYKES